MSKQKKGADEAIKKSRRSQEKIEFNGELVPRREVQQELNEMEADERMWVLTQEKANRVSSDLQKYVDIYQEQKEELGGLADCMIDTCNQLKDGKAIFDEYREFLDEDSEGCGSDYDGDGAAYWCSSIWLKNLYRRKKMVNWWKDK